MKLDVGGVIWRMVFGVGWMDASVDRLKLVSLVSVVNAPRPRKNVGSGGKWMMGEWDMNTGILHPWVIVIFIVYINTEYSFGGI